MSDSGCGSCLNVVGALVGIVGGLITIVAYFFPESDSLLMALGEAMPALDGLASGLAARVQVFAENWPLGPFLSALIVFAVIAVLRFAAEFGMDLFTYDVSLKDVFIQGLVFLPLALAWVWLFSGVVSTFWMVIFWIGYLATLVAGSFLAAEFG